MFVSFAGNAIVKNKETVRIKFLQIIDMNISECYNINKEIVDVWSRWLIS